MNRFTHNTFALLAALVLAFSSLGAIVTVPPANATSPIAAATLA